MQSAELYFFTVGIYQQINSFGLNLGFLAVNFL